MDLWVVSLPVNNQARSFKERLNEQQKQDCFDRSCNLLLTIVVQAFIVVLSAAFPVVLQLLFKVNCYILYLQRYALLIFLWSRMLHM